MGALNRVGIGLSYRHARLPSMAGQYHNSVPTRFGAPTDSSKIPALLHRRKRPREREMVDTVIAGEGGQEGLYKNKTTAKESEPLPIYFL